MLSTIAACSSSKHDQKKQCKDWSKNLGNNQFSNSSMSKTSPTLMPALTDICHARQAYGRAGSDTASRKESLQVLISVKVSGWSKRASLNQSRILYLDLVHSSQSARLFLVPLKEPLASTAEACSLCRKATAGICTYIHHSFS